MRLTLPGAFCLLVSSTNLAAQTSQPTSTPTSAPTSAPATRPVELPKLTPPKGRDDTVKGLDDGDFALVERTFPEEIHAKRYQFFQLDGYFRTRADRFRRPDLDYTAENGVDGPVLGPAGLPVLGLPVPLGANPDNIGLVRNTNLDNYSSSNLRLRAEPIFHVSESVRIKAQLDILDNVVLGSTPTAFPETGGTSPINGDIGDIFGSSQVSLGDTIRVKRAWGEAKIPYGEVRFGRMGWHFGMGVFSHDGNETGSNFGDTVNRVAFTTKLSDYLLTAAYDWGASGFTAAPAAAGALGQSFDVSQDDDLQQVVVSGMRFLTREEEEKLRKKGKLVLQYGAQGVVRRQRATTEFVDPNETDPTVVVLADRGAFTGTLDLWGKLVWKDLRLEAEAVGVYGQIECLLNAQFGQDVTQCQNAAGGQAGNALDILAGGFVIRGDYSLVNGQWSVGGEIGAASPDPQLSYSLALQQQQQLDLTQNTRFSAFLFDRDYQVDLLLFRELLGTVNGAGYLKGNVTFNPLQQLSLRGSGIFSMALAPTDGNNNPNAPLNPEGAFPLGVEFDFDAEYHTSDGFFAGISWGILAPLGGLDATQTASANTIDAKTAQAYRLRLGITF